MEKHFKSTGEFEENKHGDLMLKVLEKSDLEKYIYYVAADHLKDEGYKTILDLDFDFEYKIGIKHVTVELKVYSIKK